MKVGVVLSGGGVRGAAHVGVLKALEESGIHIDAISGTSSGSIVACLYAAGYTPQEMEEIFCNLAKSSKDPMLNYLKYFFINGIFKRIHLLNDKGGIIDIDIGGMIFFLLNSIFMKKDRIDGFLKGDALECLVNNCLSRKNVHYLCQTRIPVAFPAVDINTAQTIMFVSNKKGHKDTKKCIYIDDAYISEAVRASCAFPVVYKPKIFRGRRLVDGGINDNIPIDVLKEMGVNKVLAVNLGYSGQTKNEIDNIFEIAAQAINIMGYQLSRYNLNKADYQLRPEIYNVKLLETSKIRECINRGYEATKKEIGMIKKAIFY